MSGNCVYSRQSKTIQVLAPLFLCVTLIAQSAFSADPEMHRTAVKLNITDKRYVASHPMSLAKLSEQVVLALQANQISVVEHFGENTAQFPQHYEVNIEVGFLNFFRSEGGTWFGKCILSSTIHDVRTGFISQEFHSTVNIPFSKGFWALQKNQQSWEPRVLSDAAKALAQDIALQLSSLDRTGSAAPSLAVADGFFPQLMVMEIKAINVNQGTSSSISEIIKSTLSEHYKVQSIDALAAVNSLVEEKLKAGCDDTKCIIEVAGAMDIAQVVTGNISKLGNTYMLSLMLIQTKGENLGVIKRASEECQCTEEELIGMTQRVAAKLMQ